MARALFTSCVTFLLLLSTSAAYAEAPGGAGAKPETFSPPAFASYDPSLVGYPRGCMPGQQVACGCPGGAPGVQTCDPSGVRFSLCACASVIVTVPVVPVPIIPDFTVQRRPRKPKKRSSGLGMLIAGSITLGIGTINLIWGIERVRKYDRDALGIVMVSTGGIAMAAGLPLTIVGIVFLATRGVNPDDKQKQETGSRGFRGVTFAPTPTGLALQF